MSGSYCGIRLWFYLLMGLGAVLFLVTQLMPLGNPSRGLSLEDCDWFRQSDQPVIEAATHTLDKDIGNPSGLIGRGGGGAPAEWSTREQAIGDDAEGWKLALASGECPARNSNNAG